MTLDTRFQGPNEEINMTFLSRKIAKRRVTVFANAGRTIPYHCMHTEYEVLFEIRVEQKKITYH